MAELIEQELLKNEGASATIVELVEVSMSLSQVGRSISFLSKNQLIRSHDPRAGSKSLQESLEAWWQLFLKQREAAGGAAFERTYAQRVQQIQLCKELLAEWLAA